MMANKEAKKILNSWLKYSIKGERRINQKERELSPCGINRENSKILREEIYSIIKKNDGMSRDSLDKYCSKESKNFSIIPEGKRKKQLSKTLSSKDWFYYCNEKHLWIAKEKNGLNIT